jgi:dihydroflavonol-4-reductase
MKAFVTGSTGLLGSNLTRLLIEQGHSVVALARSPEKARAQLGASPQLTVVKGDIEDNASFSAALAGCDVLFHCAAYFREYYGRGDHWSKLERVNVHGTIDLLNRAEVAGIKRTVYVSSGGVIRARADGRPSTEADIYPRDAALENLYFKSKVHAEYAIQDWLKQHSHEVISILPSWIHGPQDAAPTAAGRLILDFLNKQLPAIPPGGASVIDARDVAQAMINAVERGRNGERYLIHNRYASLAEINQILEAVSGIPASKIHLPYPVALGMAWVMQTIASMQRKDALITVSGIRVMKEGEQHKVDGSKAMHELGITPRPFEDTLRDAVAWVRANKAGELTTTPAQVSAAA